MTGLAPALALDTLIDYDWVVEEYGIMYVVEGGSTWTRVDMR